jgi:hypothetical protein
MGTPGSRFGMDMELEVVLPDEPPSMPVGTLVDLARTAELSRR